VKLAEYRETHGNPEGSDYTFTPDPEGLNILQQIWNVVLGLAKQRSVDALNAKAIDPRSPETQRRVDLAHDTNQFVMGLNARDAGNVPNRKKKRRR